MKKFLLPLVAMLTLTTCEKEQIEPVNLEENAGIDFRARKEKITICHLNDEGVYVSLDLPEEAIEGHLRHGDLLIDADGDGYTAPGACTGSGDDCDDYDPSINPGNLLSVTVDNGMETYTLYVHPSDNILEINWGDAETDIPGLTNMDHAAALEDFDGAGNTMAIVDALQDNGGVAYAAKLCADLDYQGCDDWYLPSLGELKAIYDQLGPNGSGDIPPSGTFWSSTEQYTDYAWRQSFFSGGQFGGSKDKVNRCRCVRR